MSWWTKNRKALLPAAGLLALQFIPGVGQAVSAGLGSLTGGLLGGAAAGGAGGGTAAGLAGGAATSGLMDAAATQATAAMVPGLSSTGAGSQAAMLAAQNSGMGLTGLAKTAEAAAGAQGIGMGGKLGAGALKAADVGLDMMAGTGKAGGMMQGAQMMGLLGQPQQTPPPPRPQAMPSQPMPNFGGYGQRQSPYPTGMQALGGMDEMTKQRLRAMGYQV